LTDQKVRLGRIHDLIAAGRPEDALPIVDALLADAPRELELLLTKADLLPVLDDFDCDAAESALRKLANPAPVIRLSSKNRVGMDAWLSWLREEVRAQRARLEQGQSARPAVQPDGVRLHAHAHHQHTE
jgi:hypothetical protein